MQDKALWRPRGSRHQPLPATRSRWRPSLETLALSVVLGAMLFYSTYVHGSDASSPEPAYAAPAAIATPGDLQLPGRQALLALAGAPTFEVSGPTTQQLATSGGGIATAPSASEAVATSTPATEQAVALPDPGEETAPASVALPSSPLAACNHSHGRLYCVYEVQPGDTLASIAARAQLASTAGLPAYDLLVYSNKPALISASDVLEAGEELRVPLLNGIIHTVIIEETLSEIARRYGVLVEDITSLPQNDIADRDTLFAGQEILVPNPTLPGLPLALPGAAGGARSDLVWPATGPITSYFGPSHPQGVDIALMPGDPVTAAAAGTVAFAGGDPCCSYGLFVVIDHGNGMYTVYGHLSVIEVETGQRVDQDELLGLGGETGYGTGPHLHFEVRIGDAVVDPLSYLP